MEEKIEKKKKRARSVGQIIERGENKFLIRVYLGRDTGGKRHYHDETFHGKKTDAKKRLRDLIAKHERGEPLRLGNDTLNAFLDEWLKSNPKLKETTRAHYRRTLDYYVRPELGKKMLKKIESREIDELYAKLAADGLARSTVYYVHTLLKMVFKLAQKRRKITFNPMDGVSSPGGKDFEKDKLARREKQIMKPDQIGRFLTAAGETRFGMIFTLAFHTGCRPGELLGLRWSDLDAPARRLHIRQTINWRKGGEWYLDEPKTSYSRRVLPLTDGLLELLDAHRRRQLEERMKVGKLWGGHDLIFVDEVGEPYSQGRLRYFCKQILKAAELPENFNPYSARHSSATLLIGSGIDAKTVSKRLGHSDVRITLGTYTHPTDEMQTAASEEIERLIGGKKG
jgi:integrase